MNNTVFAQETKDKQQVHYTVQIGAFKNPPEEKLSTLNKEIGKVQSEDAGKGLKRILVGSFSSQSDAESALVKIKAAGFNNAFIKTIAAGNDIKNTGGENNVSDRKDTGTSSNTNPNNTAPSPSTDINNTGYIIQIGVYEKINFKDFENIATLGSFYVHKKDNNFVLDLGMFQNEKEANTIVEKIKKQGHPKAFLKKIKL